MTEREKEEQRLRLLWKESLQYCVLSFDQAESIPTEMMKVVHSVRTIIDQKCKADPARAHEIDYKDFTWADLQNLGVSPARIAPFMMFGMITLQAFAESDLSNIVKDVKKDWESFVQTLRTGPAAQKSTMVENSTSGLGWMAFK